MFRKVIKGPFYITNENEIRDTNGTFICSTKEIYSHGNNAEKLEAKRAKILLKFLNQKAKPTK